MSIEIKVYDLLDLAAKTIPLAGAEIDPQASDPPPHPAEAYLEVEVT